MMASDDASKSALNLSRLRMEVAMEREANEAKDRFLMVLSHELRTPLAPVLMLAEGIAMDPALSERIRADAEQICQCIRLETALIDDLLDWAKVSRNKLEVHLQPVDIHAILRDALLMVEAEARDKRQSIACDLCPVMPSSMADPTRLRQVFWNLLRNAVKFTHRGGSIWIRTQVEGEQIVVVIQDNGIGINPEIVPRLFKAFEQGDQKITRKFGGLGLGLFLVRALLELQKGSIAIESEGEGKGTTVTVRLPIAAETVPEPTPAPAQPPDAKQIVPKKLRVLVVEDNATTMKIMHRLLEQNFGYEVYMAGSVEEALRIASQHQFDILLSDIGLPDGTGWELMRVLREKYNACGIALSGYGMEEDVRRSIEAGFTSHITKPVHLRSLQHAISQALGSL